MNKIIAALTLGMSKTNFFSRLIDKDDRQVSSTNFFVIVVTLIGLVLLFVPCFVLVIEAWYNHTITTDLSGMAAYIGSVAAMFASVGITKAWTNYTESKFGPSESQKDYDGTFPEVQIDEDCNINN